MTSTIFEESDRVAILLTSRGRRKRRSHLNVDRGSTLWAPRAIGWWIGILFAVGSICFAIGALPGYLSAVGYEVDALTFFVGSLWFTSAAFLQVVEAANVDFSERERTTHRLRLFTWEPRRIDWWSTLVQFVGTLYFNATTFHALSVNLSVSQLNRLVWTPDALGSMCFLVASGLAWYEVCHTIRCWRLGSLPWWITALNLLGSVAFGVSALASFAVPTTGLPVNAALVNLGTFVGALCFFTGAVLLLPERTLPGAD
ncbi:MAG TPA: hypothetical protein VEG65_06810 [Candidatus Bathyarchaeia archaeon]|nr:hypothetical protein [Candidatus Bathyarchaeia archaeon]